MDDNWAFGFDDDIISNSRVGQKRDRLVSYNAKFCSKQWFQRAECPDSTEWLNVCKYKAEYAYRMEKYTTALQHYRAYLELLPASYLSLWRDAWEGCARCHLALHQPQEAVQAAFKLKEKALNIEHKTCFLRVLALAYKQLGNLSEWLRAVQSLVTLHPLSPDVWLQLAEAYKECMINARHTEVSMHCTDTVKTVQNATGIDGDGVSLEARQESCSKSQLVISEQLREVHLRDCFDDERTGHRKEPNGGVSPSISRSVSSEAAVSKVKCITKTIGDQEMDTTGMDLKLMVLTCFLRARLLLQSVQGTVQSFAKARNTSLQKLIHSEIEQLEVGIPKDVYEKCLQFINQDLHKADPSSTGEVSQVTEACDAEASVEFTKSTDAINKREDFESRWFWWMLPHEL